MSRMGSEILRLRKEIGLTQKQLAKQVGVSEGFIAEVEAGRKIPGSDLIARISKALRQEVGKLDLLESDEANYKEEPDKKVVKVIEKPVQAIWDDALAGVLMSVPVCNYKLDKTGAAKQLPIIDNKVEGFAKDKVIYLLIENNEMSGFRICKGDIVLAHSTQQIEKDAIYLMEYQNKRAVRQVKILDKEKLLLISNSGSLNTETASKKDVKILARLIRLEIML